MADDREVLELKPEDEIETDLDEGEDEQPVGDAEEGDEAEEQSETIIGFEGEEAAPASESDSSVIREMRAAIRERDRQIAELKRGSEPKKIEVGEKPTLESCEYDEERFETELDAWKGRKAAAERQDREQQERTKKDSEHWAERARLYETGKAKLGVTDFEAAETDVSNALPVETMAIIMQAEKSAELVYALSRNPAKLEELSKLNPLRAAMMVGKLEDKLTVTTRKLPQPDRPVVGDASPGAADKELARLEKEAERTGDRTKIRAYKKQLQARA